MNDFEQRLWTSGISVTIIELGKLFKVEDITQPSNVEVEHRLKFYVTPVNFKMTNLIRYFITLNQLETEYGYTLI